MRRTITDTNSTRVHATQMSIFFFDSKWINENVKEYHIRIRAIFDCYIDTYIFDAKCF